jgi:hypothetical protein
MAHALDRAAAVIGNTNVSQDLKISVKLYLGCNKNVSVVKLALMIEELQIGYQWSW